MATLEHPVFEPHHLAESVEPEWAVLLLIAAFAIGIIMSL